MKTRGLLLTAAALVAWFAFLHALGAREDVSVLSGTAPPDGAGSALLGGVYALSWFAAVILAPILTLGALFEVALHRLARERA